MADGKQAPLSSEAVSELQRRLNLQEQQLAVLLGVGPTAQQQNLPPRQKPHMVCFDAKTGKQIKLHRIDALEQLKRGIVVNDPAKATQQNVAALALEEKRTAGQDRVALEAMEIPALRKIWVEVHEDGADLHPQTGKKRLVTEIIEARAAQAAMTDEPPTQEPADDVKPPTQEPAGAPGEGEGFGGLKE